MQMEAGLDTGPVLLSKDVAIRSEETSSSLYAKLAELGPAALLETLSDLPAYLKRAQTQDETKVTYAQKLTKEEAELNWQQPAAVLERWVRAFNPWPMAWLESCAGTVKVWRAGVVEGDASCEPGTVLSANKDGIVIQTAEQALCITELQPQGKKAMPAADFLNARADWFPIGRQLPGAEHE